MPRVFSTSAATADLKAILTFIGSHNRIAAARVRAEFRRLFRILGRQPNIGTACEHLGRGVRCISVENYVIVFRKANNRVEVNRIVHGARDWEGLL